MMSLYTSPLPLQPPAIQDSIPSQHSPPLPGYSSQPTNSEDNSHTYNFSHWFAISQVTGAAVGYLIIVMQYEMEV